MDEPKVGIRSRLKYVVDNLEMELGHGIQQMEIAERAGVSRTTLSVWMKPYFVMGRIDVPTLYSIAKAVKEVAANYGIELEVRPEELIEFVGWSSSNKIEELLALGA